MPNRHDAIAFLRELISSTWPQRFDASELRDDVSLGEDGLNLDSVEIVELLLVAEERYGRAAGPDLWDTVPLTIASVAAYFAGDRAGAGPPPRPA